MHRKNKFFLTGVIFVNEAALFQTRDHSFTLDAIRIANLVKVFDQESQLIAQFGVSTF